MFCTLSPTCVTRSGEIQSVVDNPHVVTRGSSWLVSATAPGQSFPGPGGQPCCRSHHSTGQQLLQGPGLHCQDFCLVPQARSLLLGNLALFHKVHAQKHSASHSSTVYLPGLLFCQIRKTSPRVCFRLIKYKLRSMLSRAERKPWALLVQMQYSARLGHTSVPGTHDFPCGPWEGEERQ